MLDNLSPLVPIALIGCLVLAYIARPVRTVLLARGLSLLRGDPPPAPRARPLADDQVLNMDLATLLEAALQDANDALHYLHGEPMLIEAMRHHADGGHAYSRTSAAEDHVRAALEILQRARARA